MRPICLLLENAPFHWRKRWASESINRNDLMRAKSIQTESHPVCIEFWSVETNNDNHDVNDIYSLPTRTLNHQKQETYRSENPPRVANSSLGTGLFDRERERALPRA
jgi:hypothetical protein